MRNVLKALGIIVITAIIGFSMITCDTDNIGGDNGGKEIKKPGKQDKPAKYVLDVRDVPDSEWDIMIVGADGSNMAFNMDESTGFITRMVVKPEKDSDVTNSWVFNEDGLPDMMVSNGHLFYYNNFNGYTFDMAVEKPDGTIEYYYDNETDVNWDTFSEIFIQGDSVPKHSVQGRSVQARSAIDDFFEGGLKGADGVNTGADVIGKFMGVLSCLTALTNPVSLAGCGIFVLQEATSIFVKVAFDGIAEETGLMLVDALGCVTLDPFDCVGAATGLLAVLTSDDLKRVIPKFKVKGVTISETTLTVASAPVLDEHMYLTLSDYLSFNITPAYATNKLARWSSSDSNIVSTIASDSALPDSCRVWGKKPGTATITITTWDGNYTASCVVTVTPPPPPVDVTGVTLDKTAINLSVRSELNYAGQLVNVGDSTLIEATVQPSNATDKEVTWSSSNNAVAWVSKYNSTKATITAEGEGTALITVTTSLSGGIRYSATCTVTVKPFIIIDPAGTPGLAYEQINSSGTVVTSGGVAYRVRKGTVTGGEVFIPSTCTDADGRSLPVTQIGSASDAEAKGAFYKTYITAVHFIEPTNVTTIGSYAFSNCGNLTQIDLPEVLTSIGEAAFYDCRNLALTELPAKVTSIGASAFYDCRNLALTELPAKVTSIGASAFSGCTNLALTELPAGITSIGASAFAGCTNLALTELPARITSIGNAAFYQCSKLALTSLPAGVTSIGQNTFRSCINLALTSLPAGVTSIGAFAFNYCRNLALTELPAGVTSIGQNAFEGCTNLALTSLPARVTSIGQAAFSGCTNLALTSLSAGVTTISHEAFKGCSNLALTSLPAGVTVLGVQAFQDCTNLALTSLPAGVTRISDDTFENCTSLTQITLTAANITYLSRSAFKGCTNITSVTFQGTITNWDYMYYSSGREAETGFPGDLREKYFAEGGGIGTYTREINGTTWTKQP
jgi:uncharacterized protein YjdB